MTKVNLGTFCAVAAACVLSQSTAALAAEWTLDPAHSSAGFKVRHMMVSNVKGQFGGVNGTAEYDGKDIKSLKVNAEIDTTTVNTGDQKRDEHLRKADFFDVEKFPKMTFKSTKVVPQGKDKFQLLGDLTMHGVTKPVTLEVEGPSQTITDKKGTRMGASATTTLKRKDFGITYGGALDNGGAAIGDDVKIDLEIEMTKAKTSSK